MARIVKTVGTSTRSGEGFASGGFAETATITASPEPWPTTPEGIAIRMSLDQAMLHTFVSSCLSKLGSLAMLLVYRSAQRAGLNRSIYTRSRMNEQRPNNICWSPWGMHTGRGKGAIRLCSLPGNPPDVDRDRNVGHSFRKQSGTICRTRQKHCY